MVEKPIRSWRVIPAQDQDGWFVYFDASTERLTLRDLTEDEKLATLDSVRSVSGLIRSDTDEETDGCDKVRETFPDLSFVQLVLLEESDYE